MWKPTSELGYSYGSTRRVDGVGRPKSDVHTGDDLPLGLFSRRNLLGTVGSQTSPELVGQGLPELLLGLRLFGLVFERFEVGRAVRERRVVASLEHRADAPRAIEVVAAAVLVGVPGVRGSHGCREEEPSQHGVSHSDRCRDRVYAAPRAARGRCGCGAALCVRAVLWYYGNQLSHSQKFHSERVRGHGGSLAAFEDASR